MNEEMNGQQEMTPAQQEAQAAPEMFPLDDAAIATIQELDQQERDINIARNAMLGYFLRQHNLQGNWRVAPNRRELMRSEQGPV